MGSADLAQKGLLRGAGRRQKKGKSNGTCTVLFRHGTVVNCGHV